MLNSIIIMGRLTAHPELKKTPSGVSVCSFSICSERDYGEHEKDFFDVVAWRGTAEFICRNFEKGQMILIHGHLQTRNWTDKQGNKRHSVEIVAGNTYFCGKKAQKTSPATQFYYEDIEITEQDTEPILVENESDGDLPF